MVKNKDHVIGELLIYTNDKSPESVSYLEFINSKYGISGTEVRTYRNHFDDTGLFIFHNERDITLSKLGREVIEKYGNWSNYKKSLKPKKQSWIKEHYMKAIVIPLVGFGLAILGYYIKVQIDKDQRQTTREETYQLIKQSIQSNLESRR